MLVITGTQRCGTTVIAQCLERSGYDLGSTLWDEAGGLENETICAFYRDYMGDPTFPFDDFVLPPAEQATWEHFAEMDYEVVKFSYLLMNPVFVYIWFKFRSHQDDTFLIMSRRKEDVVESKARLPNRFAHDSILLKQSSRQLYGNYADSLIVLHSMPVFGEYLNFPDCLSDLSFVNYQLARLDPNVQISKRAWERTVDLSKVHIK